MLSIMRIPCVFLAILTMAMVVGATGAVADTIPAGDVSGTWDLDGSPYLITGQITVPANQTLVVDAGVEILFQGNNQWYVNGQLLLQGTEADMILITAESQAIGWGGLRFMDNSEQPLSEVRYCRLEYGKVSGSCPGNSGGAVYVGQGMVLIEYCQLMNNTSVFGSGAWGGGAICCEYSSPIIRHNTFEGNSTGGDGGAIYCYFSSPEIHDNVMINNSAYRGAAISCVFYSAADIRGNIIDQNPGRAVYLSGSAATLVNNIITGNNGAVQCYLCDPQIVGNLIAGNSATTGAAIFNQGSSPEVVNNTIADNTASQYGGGIANQSVFVGVPIPSSPVVTNTILYGNAGSSGSQVYSFSSCATTFNYCNVQDTGSGGVEGTAYFGDGNLDETPGFVGSGDHPYSLQEDSVCRDAGTPDCSGLPLPAEDLVGNLRVCGGCIDMGAYEFSAASEVPDGLTPVVRMLDRVYPNPFNPYLVIKYTLERAVEVDLAVYMLNGRRVVTLNQGQHVAGKNEAIWDGLDRSGRTMPSGMYLVRLVAGARSESAKIALVR